MTGELVHDPIAVVDGPSGASKPPRLRRPSERPGLLNCGLHVKAAALLLLSALFVFPAAAAQDSVKAGGSDGELLLDRLSELYLGMETLRIDFIQTQSWVGMEDMPPWRGRILLMRPNKFRIEYEEPEGHVQVGDGERVWTYVPENSEVLVTKIAGTGSAGGDLLRWILETGRPDPVVPQVALRGAQSLVLTLRPDDELGIDQVRIWVELGGPGILQYEILDSSGNRNVYEVLSMRPNDAIDRSLFHFRPPEGIPVVELGSP